MTPLRGYLICLLLCLPLVPGMARAQLAPTCSFSASDVVLGQVDTLGTGPTDSRGTIYITCSALIELLSSVEISIHLGDGREGAGGGMRRMTSPATATSLAYQLYSDASRSLVAGGSYSSSGGQRIDLNRASLLGLLVGSRAEVPLYARAPGGQAGVRPGSYSSAFARNPQDVLVEYRTCLTPLICANRSTTFSFTVGAEVSPNCRVTAGDLDFGRHGLLSADIDAASAMSVTCTSGTAYAVSLGNGLYGTDMTTRQMRDGAGHAIAYQLYRDPARSLAWGGPGFAATGAGSGAGQGFTVYGRVPAQPTPPPGTYSDSVVVTVEY